MSAKTIVFEYICPAMGAIFANLMWLAPISSVNEALSIRHTLGELNPIPWAMMLGNCVGWVAYSFIVKDCWPLIANAPGVVIAIWLNMSAAKLQFYEKLQFSKIEDQNENENKEVSSVRSLRKHDQIVEKLQFSQIEDQNENEKKEVSSVQSLTKHDQLVLVIVILWSSVLSVISFYPMSTDTQRLIVGVTVNLNLFFFYGGPLSTIFTILKTRNSVTIHLRTLAMNTANATYWTLYAIAISDFYIALPNAIGILLGVIQIFLTMLFPRKQPEANDDIESALEIVNSVSHE